MERLVLSVLLAQLIPVVVTTSVSLFRMEADTSNNWNKGYPYNKTVLSEEDCKLKCLRDDECKAITHYVMFGIHTCSLYKKAQTERRPPSDEIVVAGIGNKVFTKARGKEDLQKEEPFSPATPAAPELQPSLPAEPITWTDRFSVRGKMYAKLKLPNDQSFNYSTSKVLCHANGGKLPEPRTRLENDYLAHMSRTRIWLGMKNKDGKGNLMWESDNSSVAWLNWETQGRETGHLSALRTRGLDVDNCAMIVIEPYLSDNHTYYMNGWDAFRCSDTVSTVVCEKQKRSIVRDPQTGKQYTTVNDGSRNYEQSKAFCASIGGILPEPKSQEETDFVAALADTTILLGMNDEDEEGKWVWDSDGSYVNWTYWENYHREPNGEKRENCAIILKNGYPRNVSAWWDWNCNRPFSRVVCEKDIVCRNTECKNAAERISRNLNTSVNPCDDMYEFSCGGWVHENPIPDDKQEICQFDLLRKKIQVIIKALIEKEISEEDIESERQLKTLYTSCMNTGAVNLVGDSKMKALLTEEFGGWPIITPEWSSQDFNLEDMMIKLRRLNGLTVFGITVHADAKNSNKNALYIVETSLGLGSREYYLVPRNDPKLTAYQNYIEGVARQMGGATVDLEAVKRDATAIVNFEIKLAKISYPAEYFRDKKAMYSTIQTLAEVHGNYSSAVFDWRSFVNKLMGSPGVGVTDITDEEKIFNIVPSYYGKLTQLLKDTDTRTLSNYLLWRLVREKASYLGDDYRQNMTAWGEYRTIMYGTQSDTSREEKCLHVAKHHGKDVLGRMFINNNLKPGVKDDLLEMIQNVQAAFNKTIDKHEWMDAESKRAAKTKNAKISYKIAYPEFIRNDTYMDEKFGHYNYDADDLFGNIMRSEKSNVVTTLKKLRQPVDKGFWWASAMETNAYYWAPTNAITFPAGILLPPFYSGDFPKYLNYGAIGQIVGHEVTHGFDDAGSEWGGDGNLVNWWSDAARAEFKKRSKCMVEQYGNFTIPELNMKMNGVLTLGENIADNAGLKESFRAYRKWVKDSRRGEEPLLPGLKYTPNQLFFINHYQSRCRSGRQQYLLKQLRTGTHSPGRFRTIGTAQNSEDFAKAFHCPVGSPMNPSKKCSVW